MMVLTAKETLLNIFYQQQNVRTRDHMDGFISTMIKAKRTKRLPLKAYTLDIGQMHW